MDTPACMGILGNKFSLNAKNGLSISAILKYLKYSQKSILNCTSDISRFIILTYIYNMYYINFIDCYSYEPVTITLFYMLSSTFSWSILQVE